MNGLEKTLGELGITAHVVIPKPVLEASKEVPAFRVAVDRLTNVAEAAQAESKWALLLGSAILAALILTRSK